MEFAYNKIDQRSEIRDQRSEIRDQRSEPVLLSVITSTFNRADMLKRSVDSVLNQNLKNIEHIIIDNCSTDDTEQLVKNIQAKDPRVIYIKNTISVRQEENRGRGLTKARGKYIAFIDDDDYYTDMDFFKRAVEIFENNPEKNLAFVAANVEIKNEDSGEISRNDIGATGYMSGMDYIFNPNNDHHKPISTFPAVRKAEYLKQAGLCDKFIFDTNSYYYSALYGGVYLLPDVIGVYVVHNKSQTVGYHKGDDEYIKKFLLAYSECLKQYKELRDILYTRINKKIVSRWYASTIVGFNQWCFISVSKFSERIYMSLKTWRSSGYMPRVIFYFVKAFLRPRLSKITPLKKLYRFLKGKR